MSPSSNVSHFAPLLLLDDFPLANSREVAQGGLSDNLARTKLNTVLQSLREINRHLQTVRLVDPSGEPLLHEDFLPWKEVSLLLFSISCANAS